MPTQRHHYKKQSNWISGFNYALNKIDVDLLAVLGTYNPRTNKNGLVRDHIFPRHGGFKYRVFPELLRHPANCRFITHSENGRKGLKYDFSVTPSGIEELFQRIENWPSDWSEQAQCLSLIRDYRRGYCYDPESKNRVIKTQKTRITKEARQANKNAIKAAKNEQKLLDKINKEHQKQLEEDKQLEEYKRRLKEQEEKHRIQMEFADFTNRRRIDLIFYAQECNSYSSNESIVESLNNACNEISKQIRDKGKATRKINADKRKYKQKSQELEKDYNGCVTLA